MSDDLAPLPDLPPRWRRLSLDFLVAAMVVVFLALVVVVVWATVEDLGGPR